MKHNLLSDRQISEIEERLNSTQKLLMMDVAALIKEMRTYRELLRKLSPKRLGYPRGDVLNYDLLMTIYRKIIMMCLHPKKFSAF